MTYKITDFMGNQLELCPRLELYSTRDFMGKEMPSLAIALDDISTGEAEEYCMLTVSFGEYIGVKNCAYIDANNCDFTDQLLEQGLAQPTGFTKHSGFCEYPLWVFDEEKLKEMGEKNYQTYSEAYDEYVSDNYGEDDSEEESIEISM